MSPKWFQGLASLLLLTLLSVPLFAQEKEKPAEKPPEKAPEPAAQVEKSPPVPLYTVAGLALMLVLTIVCMPTRKNN